MTISISVNESPKGYIVHGENFDDAIFSGEGTSLEEAIGRWVISNREALGLKMVFNNLNGEKELKFSTEYCKGRSASELTDYELRYVEALKLVDIFPFLSVHDNKEGDSVEILWSREPHNSQWITACGGDESVLIDCETHRVVGVHFAR